MKKIMSLAVITLLASTASAQSALELAKQQKELNAINRQLLEEKPTKDAKKQAKVLVKNGWQVPAGNKSIELQITKGQLLGEELMADEGGAPVKRYIMQTSIQTAGSYNTGYAAARANAQAELAAMLKTEIAGAWQLKQDNDQLSSVSSTTNDKFNQRLKAIIDASLSNTVPYMAIYRYLPNNNMEVQVGIAFDKKELMARMKRNMKKELENDGDALNELVDEVIKKKM